MMKRRDLLATAGTVGIALLAGCSSTVTRTYRDHYEFSDQHEDLDVEIDVPGEVHVASDITGTLTVENKSDVAKDAKLLIEVRAVDGPVYRMISDIVTVQKYAWKDVDFRAKHGGTGRYEVSVAGFADDATVVVTDAIGNTPETTGGGD